MLPAITLGGGAADREGGSPRQDNRIIEIGTNWGQSNLTRSDECGARLVCGISSTAVMG